MLDLKKIKENFKNLFETETEDSFNEWLFEKKKQESLSLLSNKKLIECRPVIPQGSVWVIQSPIFSKPFENKVPQNIKYGMAA